MDINAIMAELAQYTRMAEEKAAAIWNWENKTPFEEKQKAVEKLLQEFCLKNGGSNHEKSI